MLESAQCVPLFALNLVYNPAAKLHPYTSPQCDIKNSEYLAGLDTLIVVRGHPNFIELNRIRVGI